jgi:hypothetical protein
VALGEAEVEQDDLALGGELDILGLDVAVEHGGLPRVDVVEGGEELLGPGEDLVDGEGGVAAGLEGREVGAAEELHDEEAAGGVAEVVDDPGEGGVAEGGEDLGLALEGLGVLLGAAEHLLEGDRIAEAAVDGLVDGAHAAAPDQPDDLVALKQQRSGVEHRVTTGRRRSLRAIVA